MMYLTQAFVDFDTALRLSLHNIYDWHKTVWKAFPNRPDEKRDFLIRVERQERDRRFRLLILSALAPVCPAGWPAGTGAWMTKPVSDRFLAQPAYRFQLRANPTKRDSKTKKRLPLLTWEDQVKWLDRKAEQSGFSVVADRLRIIPEGRQRFRDRSNKKDGIHHAVEFEGILTVTDSASFRTAFAKGIGSAKAFGFGLLALVPCSPPEETQ